MCIGKNTNRKKGKIKQVDGIIKIENKTRPKSEPCGTPNVMIIC